MINNFITKADIVFTRTISLPNAHPYIRKNYKLKSIEWTKFTSGLNRPKAPHLVCIILFHSDPNQKSSAFPLILDEKQYAITTQPQMASVVYFNAKTFSINHPQCFVGFIKLKLVESLTSPSGTNYQELMVLNDMITQFKNTDSNIVVYLPLHPQLCNIDRHILFILKKMNYDIIPDIITITDDNYEAAVFSATPKDKITCINLGISLENIRKFSKKINSKIPIFLCQKPGIEVDVNNITSPTFDNCVSEVNVLTT